MPTQSFRAAASTPTSPDEAWTSLQRAATWEGVAGVDEISNAAHAADGALTSFDFTVSVGTMRYPGTSRVTHAERPRHMRLELTTTELVATIEVRLTDMAGDTGVEVDLAVSTKTFLAALFFGAIADSIGRGLPAATEAFAQRLAAVP
ncbi:MAG TPA: hypothetical protein VMS74_09635 [Acidimicrobiia bacterium]|nr:hypothetical protein [Acidimicrobiia bacterium]